MIEQSREDQTRIQASPAAGATKPAFEISSSELRKLTGIRALVEELLAPETRGFPVLVCEPRSVLEGAFLVHLGWAPEVCGTSSDSVSRSAAHAPMKSWLVQPNDFRLPQNHYELAIWDRTLSSVRLDETVAFEFARSLKPRGALAVFVPAQLAQETSLLFRTAGLLLSKKGQASVDALTSESPASAQTDSTSTDPGNENERILIFRKDESSPV